MLSEKLEKLGFVKTEKNTDIDISIINTCTVTDASDRKTRKTINKYRKKSKFLVVMGCYVDINGTVETADLSIKNIDKDIADELILKLTNTSANVFHFGSERKKTRAFLKIQDGCNEFCSYCIIPYARGRIKSVKKELVIEDIKDLVKRNYKEIVLTGIHLSSYGKDYLYSLETLLRTISDSGIDVRIRLGSLESSIINEKFMGTLKKIKGFCPHFHLSLQSGSDFVLKKMHRKYTTDDFYKRVELIREYFKEAAITTDIICGFPLEEEKHFDESIAFVKKVKFSDIHAFSYSARTGTISSRYKDLDMSEKRERTNRMIEVAEQLKSDYLNSFIGKELEVLFEKKDGLTRYYQRVETKEPREKNSIENIKIKSVYQGKLRDWR